MNGRFIKGIRFYFGKTVREFAADTGLSAPMIYFMENGQRRITDKSLFKITMAYDITVETLEEIERLAKVHDYVAANGD